MRRFSIMVVLALTPPMLAESDYEIRFIQPSAAETVARLESQPTEGLAGKSITAIFGLIAEVRLDGNGINRTADEGDPQKVAAKIRARLDQAQCLGRVGEIRWHQAPWISGYLLLENRRILPVKLLLSGIVVGDLLFDDHTPPPIRASDALASAAALLREHHAEWGQPERVLRTGANWYRIEYRNAPEGSERVVLVNPDNGQAEFPLRR